jgi:protein associated with RNAse G/E
MKKVTVYKLNPAGQVTWQYQGSVLQHTHHAVVVEAYFDRQDMPFQGITLKRRDRFVETFYDNRWYNLFEIYDRDDGQRKGWYCNICHPAVIRDDSISYIDLALDLWVTPDGQQTILDEDEFAGLDLDGKTRTQALAALGSLQSWFQDQWPLG